MKFYVSYSAVYSILATVDAETEEEAVEKVRNGEIETEEGDFSYIHPDTEFFVEVKEDNSDD